MRRSHPTRSHLVSRAPSSCDSISSLYTSPTSSDTLPVYESITLTWNPACVDVGTETVDLYLNVVEEVGLIAVHEWTGVEYGKGELITQLKPGWWNASTGAGEVQAQVRFISFNSRDDEGKLMTGRVSTYSSGSFLLVNRFGILQHQQVLSLPFLTMDRKPLLPLFLKTTPLALLELITFLSLHS